MLDRDDIDIGRRVVIELKKLSLAAAISNRLTITR